MEHDNSNALMHEIGKIAGKLDMLGDAVNDNLTNLRQDIQHVRDDMNRIHAEHSAGLQQLREEIVRMIAQSERRMEARLNATNIRVDRLEEQDKRFIAKLASLTAAGGGIGSMITIIGTELLKRMI